MHVIPAKSAKPSQVYPETMMCNPIQVSNKCTPTIINFLTRWQHVQGVKYVDSQLLDMDKMNGGRHGWYDKIRMSIPGMKIIEISTIRMYSVIARADRDGGMDLWAP